MSRRVLLLVLAILVLGACSKKDVKVQSEDSKLALEAFAVAENMRVTYVKKEFKALEEYTTESGYRSISRNLGNFDKVELEFRNRWVEIDGDKVVLNVSWEGTWTIAGRERKNRGMAVFEMVGSPLRLNRVLQASPFKNP